MRDYLAAIGAKGGKHRRAPAAGAWRDVPKAERRRRMLALAEKRWAKRKSRTKWVRHPSRSEMAVGPPLLGRDGEERAGSGS